MQIYHKVFCISIVLTVGTRGTRFSENYNLGFALFNGNICKKPIVLLEMALLFRKKTTAAALVGELNKQNSQCLNQNKIETSSCCCSCSGLQEVSTLLFSHRLPLVSAFQYCNWLLSWPCCQCLQGGSASAGSFPLLPPRVRVRSYTASQKFRHMLLIEQFSSRIVTQGIKRMTEYRWNTY